MGRPKIILDLWENWYNEVLDLYQKGASDVEVKALIYSKRGSFSNDLWDRWMKEEPQFSETIKTGKLLSKAWWYKNGRINLQSKEFNYTGWYMQMKNRFGWTDRVDNTTKGKEIKPEKTTIKFVKKS
jgi:hypothetical protein